MMTVMGIYNLFYPVLFHWLPGYMCACACLPVGVGVCNCLVYQWENTIKNLLKNSWILAKELVMHIWREGAAWPTLATQRMFDIAPTTSKAKAEVWLKVKVCGSLQCHLQRHYNRYAVLRATLDMCTRFITFKNTCAKDDTDYSPTQHNSTVAASSLSTDTCMTDIIWVGWYVTLQQQWLLHQNSQSFTWRLWFTFLVYRWDIDMICFILFVFLWLCITPSVSKQGKFWTQDHLKLRN